MKPGEKVTVHGREFVSELGWGVCNECHARGGYCSQMPPCSRGTNPDGVDLTFKKVEA